MNNKQFEQIINRQFDRCKELLVTKGKEYTPDKDVFEVFNKAATLSGEGGRKAALFNFMLKHLVSISDMCHSNETYSMDRWNEKITDAMNYLLLLKAMIEEDEILRNDPIWRATGYSSEELIEKLADTEIRFDQVFKRCSDDCNKCSDANCDGSDEAFLDCKNNCNGCIHLSCGRRADNDELLEETTAEDWEEFWKNIEPEEAKLEKRYDFSKYHCDLDFPYCILGGPDRCPTCKHWIEEEPSLSVEEEIARAKALEDDLK